MSVLDVKDLSVDFGHHRNLVLDKVSLAVDDGQRLGLVGASGSGKTVLASAIMGLLPDNAHISGEILFRGTNLASLGDREFSKIRGRKLSMVFQEPMTALDPTMKVGLQAAELISLHRDSNPMATRDRVEQVFDRVGLSDAGKVTNAYPHELSGGQRQRVIIAMALMNRPALVICDEPTTALDATVQTQVLDVLDSELAASGAACLFISHDLNLVARMCNEVAVIHAGRIVERGTTEDVLNSPRHPYTRGLLATARIDQVEPGERLPVIEDFYTPDDRDNAGRHTELPRRWVSQYGPRQWRRSR
ncbi:MAG: ABC transporter ATP-binding protein [Propionibacteriaceae bacterium]|jgi:peptide/nickel transport system ATP-binding protein|nr:ABC transporter ATP-binding protein [Propionibacteriaceae bacterium]